jgi:hypothetical protein
MHVETFVARVEHSRLAQKFLAAFQIANRGEDHCRMKKDVRILDSRGERLIHLVAAFRECAGAIWPRSRASFSTYLPSVQICLLKAFIR